MITRVIDKKKKKHYEQHDFKAIRNNCVASTVSKANRIVGRIYEEAFREVNISSPQFELLVSLKISPGSTAGEIAETLGADPSTVSRNTELLNKRGLICVAHGTDRRVRVYHLTDEGEATIQECVPMWKAAQRRAVKQIGRGYWDDIRRRLRKLENV